MTTTATKHNNVDNSNGNAVDDSKNNNDTDTNNSNDNADNTNSPSFVMGGNMWLQLAPML